MKKLLLCSALLLAVGGSAFGQGAFVSGSAQGTVNGALRSLAGATVTVCAANTTGIPCSPPLANTLFKDQALTQPLANPTTTDANGNYNFAVAAGTYTLTITATGFTGSTQQITVTCGTGGCTATSLTVTGAATLGSLTVSGTGTLANINAELYVGTGTGQYATVAAAITACASNGCTIHVTQSLSTLDSSTITLSKPVHIIFDDGTFTFNGTGNLFSCTSVSSIWIQGSGGRWGDSFANQGTQINVTNTAANALSTSGCEKFKMTDLSLVGPSSGTGKGIVHKSDRGVFRDMSIVHFGSDCFTIDGSSVSANVNTVQAIRCSSNGGHGFVAIGTNGNLTSFLSDDSASNTGDSFRIGSRYNSFHGTNTTASGSGIGYHFISPSSQNWGDIYADVGDTITFDSGANNNSLISIDIAINIVDNGASNTVDWNSLEFTRIGFSPAFGFATSGSPPVERWAFSLANSGPFSLLDRVNGGATRLQINPLGLTDVMSGTGSQPVRINAQAGSGTGGLEIWGGGTTPVKVAAVNSSGNLITTNSFSGNTVALTADWTCGTGGTVASCTTATIIGSGGGVPLTFTLPLFANSYTLQCDGVVGQATAATLNQWNLLTATNGATNVTANYWMATAGTASAYGAVTDQTATTTTFQIAPSWTLGGTATKMPFHVWAKIEGASALGTVVSLQLVAPTVADLVTIYRGTACTVF